MVTHAWFTGKEKDIDSNVTYFTCNGTHDEYILPHNENETLSADYNYRTTHYAST